MFIVMLGNLVDGHGFVGPFESHEDADIWAEFNCKNEDWWIIELSDPKASIEEPNDE